MLGGSESFRLEVCKSLLNKKPRKNKSAKSVMREFKEEIKKKFPLYASDEKVPAVKFLRSFPFSPELKNELKKIGVMDKEDYIGMFNAKKFIESI